ncbi:MAG: hypothetical protein ACI8SR_000265 [Oceanicoccus sp.]|jgi:hypothetical protein
MQLLKECSNNISQHQKNGPYYLTHDFYMHLDTLRIDALNKTKSGLTPRDYEQYSKLLTCYSAAQAAIKKLTS